MPLVPVKSEQTNAVSMTVAIRPVVRTFCDQRGLGGPLEQAIAIAQRCFGDVESWEIEMEYDPETGDEWRGCPYCHATKRRRSGRGSKAVLR